MLQSVVGQSPAHRNPGYGSGAPEGGGVGRSPCQIGSEGEGALQSTGRKGTCQHVWLCTAQSSTRAVGCQGHRQRGNLLGQQVLILAQHSLGSWLKSRTWRRSGRCLGPLCYCPLLLARRTFSDSEASQLPSPLSPTPGPSVDVASGWSAWLDPPASGGR